MAGGLRLGNADHFGWAVAVTASADHIVVDRRRIELVEPGVTSAPVHYDSAHLDVAATAALVADVRASAVRASSAAFDELARNWLRRSSRSCCAPCLRTSPPTSPSCVSRRRRPTPTRSCTARCSLELAGGRGWDVRFYEAKTVIARATHVLGARADEVLQEPRATLGPPWGKDHRTALAAVVVA